MEYSYGELNMHQSVREFIQCWWTLNLYSNDREDEWVHDHYIEAVKKQLGIFLDVCHVLFSVSPKREALLWSYELADDILQAY